MSPTVATIPATGEFCTNVTVAVKFTTTTTACDSGESSNRARIGAIVEIFFTEILFRLTCDLVVNLTISVN